MSDPVYKAFTTYNGDGEPIATGSVLAYNFEPMAELFHVHITEGVIDRESQYVDAEGHFQPRLIMDLSVPTAAPWTVTGVPPKSTIVIDNNEVSPYLVNDGVLELELDPGVYDIEIRAPKYRNTKLVLEVTE